MFAKPEQFSTATKAQLEAQLASISELSNKAFASVTQLVDLNVTAAKASFDQTTAIAQQLLSAKDPQEFFSLTAAQTQPTAETALAYGRNLANIASSTQAE